MTIYRPGAARVVPELNPLSLMKFRAARALKTRNTKIAFIGDSTFAGVETGGTSIQAQHSIPMQLAAKLQARGINAGANNRFGCSTATFANLLLFDSRVTSTGSWSQVATQAVGGNASGATAAGSMTFTPQGNVTKFDIWWRDGSAGRQFSWAVDAGGATTISSSGTTQVFKTTVSAGTAGAHALTLAWVAGSVIILGIDAYDDTSSRRELSIWNWGISGATSAQLIDNTDTLAGRLASMTAMAPDLSIIEGGIINDWRNSLGTAATVANLTTLFSTCQAVGDVIYYTPRFDNSSTGDAANQQSYVDAAKALAASKNIPIFDARSLLGSFAIANAAGFYSDTVHGDTGGAAYGDEAEHLVRALLAV